MANYKTTPSLGFVEACKLASGRLTQFSGRSRRSEFWWWILVVMVVENVITMFFPSQLLLNAILSIVLMAPGLSVTARRLQDTGRSAMWVYVSYGLSIILNLTVAFSDAFSEIMELLEAGNTDEIVAVVQGSMGNILGIGLLSAVASVVSLIVVVFCLLDSTPGPNKYGDSPKYVSAED